MPKEAYPGLAGLIYHRGRGRFDLLAGSQFKIELTSAK